MWDLSDWSSSLSKSIKIRVFDIFKTEPLSSVVSFSSTFWWHNWHLPPVVAPLEIARQSKSCHIASSDERCSGHQLWHFKTKTYLMVFIYLHRPMQSLHQLWSSTISATLGKPVWIQNTDFQWRFWIGLEIILNSLRPPISETIRNSSSNSSPANLSVHLIFSTPVIHLTILIPLLCSKTDLSLHVFTLLPAVGW